jgi:hypothetical protein
MDSNDIDIIVEKVILDDSLIKPILERILSKNDEIREKNFRILLQISRKYPKVLYSKWDFLVDLLKSDNHFHRYMSINLIANIASNDISNKFKEIFDEYFGNIRNNRTMVAGQTTLNSGKIANKIPSLIPKITNILLNIDKIHKGKQIELLNGYAIESFNEYFDKIKDKNEILNFVKKQLNSNSPKTRKNAKEFIEKWNFL